VDHSKNGGEGCEGHGPAWLDTIVALEQAFQAEVSWVVDMNVVSSGQMNIEIEEGWCRISSNYGVGDSRMRKLK
jgi:hypothetical protein